MKDAISEAYASVAKFNEVSGQHDNVTVETVNHAISMAFSELEELIEAFENKDIVETAKEAADLLVTVFGIIQKLEITGIAMGSVINAVCDNNDSKYVPQGQPLQYDESLTASFNQKYQCWVVRDAEGKVKKHANYQKCDVSEFVFGNMFKENQC